MTIIAAAIEMNAGHKIRRAKWRPHLWLRRGTAGMIEDDMGRFALPWMVADLTADDWEICE